MKRKKVDAPDQESLPGTGFRESVISPEEVPTEMRGTFFSRQGRKILPVLDSTEQDAALLRLEDLRDTYWETLPQAFKDHWNSVALYSPSGQAEEATALILDPDNGAYDVTNKLNHLTGKEWIRFTCSWFVFNALQSDLAEERQADPDSKNHPAAFSPTMISDFVRFFTKEGARVLDPFAGIGSTLVACKRTNRVGFGIELNKDFYKIALKRTPEFQTNLFNCSAEEIRQLDLPEFDFSISSPPYWDVLNRSTKDFKSKRDSNGLQSNYSGDSRDLGNLENYDEFLLRLTDVYRAVSERLRNGAYLVVIVKNVKKSGKLFPLAWDLARSLSEFVELRDEKIWIQDKIGLAPYGYPHAWTSNILHHYCLIFQKPR